MSKILIYIELVKISAEMSEREYRSELSHVTAQKSLIGIALSGRNSELKGDF